MFITQVSKSIFLEGRKPAQNEKIIAVVVDPSVVLGRALIWVSYAL